uniref:Adenylate kinase n=2 Tax=candidate division WOR-3 bacterium TaxID=2052148 RepID=A0A7V3ZTK3_UNCW3
MVEEGKGFIFIGPPGSGKGTQAKKLAEFLNYSFISTGDILREEVKRNTKIGKFAKEYMEKGLLVPDDLMLKIIKKNLKKGIRFILDGFPRTIEQAKGLDEILKKKSLKIEKVFYLNVDEDEIIKRLSSRRVCPLCKRIYNLLVERPKNDEICDICNVKLILRDDDKEEVIKKRIEVYKKDTEKLISYYKDKLIEIDGEGEPEKIFENIKNSL